MLDEKAEELRRGLPLVMYSSCQGAAVRESQQRLLWRTQTHAQGDSASNNCQVLSAGNHLFCPSSFPYSVFPSRGASNLQTGKRNPIWRETVKDQPLSAYYQFTISSCLKFL